MLLNERTISMYRNFLCRNKSKTKNLGLKIHYSGKDDTSKYKLYFVA